MAIKYKYDVLGALKEAGYNTTRLRKEKIFGEGTIQKLRSGEPVGAAALDTLCCLLKCQPGDLLQYDPDGEE